MVECRPTARISVRRGELARTKHNATPEQLDTKVCPLPFRSLFTRVCTPRVKFLHASVLQSVEITQRITIYQLFVMISTNRRGLVNLTFC